MDTVSAGLKEMLRLWQLAKESTMSHLMHAHPELLSMQDPKVVRVIYDQFDAGLTRPPLAPTTPPGTVQVCVIFCDSLGVKTMPSALDSRLP
jgi:hypothetical protein